MVSELQPIRCGVGFELWRFHLRRPDRKTVVTGPNLGDQADHTSETQTSFP
jgi:hypothetical protein